MEKHCTTLSALLYNLSPKQRAEILANLAQKGTPSETNLLLIPYTDSENLKIRVRFYGPPKTYVR